MPDQFALSIAADQGDRGRAAEINTRHSGAPRSGEPGIHTPDGGYGFRAHRFAMSRNDNRGRDE
jgi:hypothetical protein